ncbi:MAG TPA: hypothetical protein VHP63_00190 [candidate division Zixibacteria bacterium]|nr:hypothetical protein [candidate division Zixibacteria bacterium]
MNEVIAGIRTSFAKPLLIVPIIIVYCLLDCFLIRSYVVEIFQRPINSAVGSMGAPFGGLILAGIYVVLLGTGLLGAIVGMIARKLGWILFLVSFFFMLGTAAYPFFLFQIDSGLDLNATYFNHDELVGHWEDNTTELEIFENYKYKLKNKSGSDTVYQGTWQINSGNLILYQDAAILFSYRFARKKGKLFLCYSLRDYQDPDTWDGNLGLFKTPVKMKYGFRFESCRGYFLIFFFPIQLYKSLKTFLRRRRK